MGVKQILTRTVSGIQNIGHMPKRSNRVAPELGAKWGRQLGIGQNWAPLSYGEYYPRSASVYAAIKARQDAVVRVPLKLYRRRRPRPQTLSARSDGFLRIVTHVEDPRLPSERGRVGDNEPRDPESFYRGTDVRQNGVALSSIPKLTPLGARAHDEEIERASPDHPVQRLLDAPNPFWTRGDLWRATETYLGLWGSAYWGLERNEIGQVIEIWPLRSDRMRVIPDPERYIKGFVYVGSGQQLVPYVPEDIVWIHYFNPLDEYAGLSPIAPLRLSADMGMDALRANRSNLANDSTPGLFIETTDTPTDDEVREFYERWESRYKGVDKTKRPALLSSGMKPVNMGFSPRDMEYINSLRWSLEDVARVYGVPRPMIGDIERLTFSNFQTARRVFWEDTIVPQLIFYQEALQQMLLPNFGDPSLFVEFDLGAIEALRESENDKAARRRLYVETGIMTIDEIRREMNLPPLGDGG
jgi:HK97 family phage portal protein